MIFTDHSKLKGKHALLAPSQPTWLNYPDEEKLYQKYKSIFAQEIGTQMHELAETLIKSNIKLGKSDKKVLLTHLLTKGIPRNVIDIDYLFGNFANYVNDAIGFKMTPEQILVYSEDCFGTADTICFRDKILRIHDLKTGRSPVHIEQLMVYAALFCLEYNHKPTDIEIELRIYQDGNVIFHNATADDILPIMDKIVTSAQYIQTLRMEG